MACKSKCTVLQQQHDQNKFGSSYYFITQVQGLDAAHKLLLITMCDNVWLNGQVDWAQKTYAVKTGTSRRSINAHFSKYVELGILQPISEKKNGTKDKYRLVYGNIKKLIRPVKPATKTCEAGDTRPVKPATSDLCNRLHTYNSYNKNNSYNGDDESSFRNDSSSQPEETQKPKIDPIALAAWASMEL